MPDLEQKRSGIDPINLAKVYTIRINKSDFSLCLSCSLSEEIMSAIQEITIRVPSDIAEAYSRATDSQRQQIALKIGVMLTGVMSEKETAIDRIKQQMDDISREATANGMTPEILASILNENG